jgi:hypothetical protein
MTSSKEQRIDRRALVKRHNPIRRASNLRSPMQVGNGAFAFNVDITGLQTFVPFATMAEWGWKNDLLPAGQERKEFLGRIVNTHGRDVRYDMPNEQKELSQWLISNPNKMNLARIGLWFGDYQLEEKDLNNCHQVLDLWTGQISSSFEWNDAKVSIETTVHPEVDAIRIKINSPLVSQGDLGIFLDFPFNDGSKKFSAPYVGDFERVAAHTTKMEEQSPQTALITHSVDDASYYVGVRWQSEGNLTHLKNHRYILKPSGTSTDFEASILFSKELAEPPQAHDILIDSQRHWPSYWNDGGIIDLSLSIDPRWLELERRIILSQYVMAVNCTGTYPPQESGLVNLGWYGKFHMEMYLWHSAHLALFNKWTHLNRSLSIYQKFLPSAKALALSQGYKGARWPKMTDPSGRMAPGEINSLLIWQQPHPIFFAELEFKAHNPNPKILDKWKNILLETADFMASYVTWNDETQVYDLGPPMHTMSENTDGLRTSNPAFELQYWRFGLTIALKWWERLNLIPPAVWKAVLQNMALLPVRDGLYVMWPGVKNMWHNYNWEHPSLSGLYGLLPSYQLDLQIMKRTTNKIWETWRFDKCWGWDFGMLAMNAVRSGMPEKAVEFLLHKNLIVDDVGLVEGTTQVPKPYFPANGALLYAVAFMAAGWNDANVESDGNAPGFPYGGWVVRHEGLSKAL